jgi:hypothetical protein
LIALIINAHPLGSGTSARALNPRSRERKSLRTVQALDIDLERPACLRTVPTAPRSSNADKAPRDFIAS